MHVYSNTVICFNSSFIRSYIFILYNCMLWTLVGHKQYYLILYKNNIYTDTVIRIVYGLDRNCRLSCEMYLQT